MTQVYENVIFVYQARDWHPDNYVLRSPVMQKKKRKCAAFIVKRVCLARDAIHSCVTQSLQCML